MTLLVVAAAASRASAECDPGICLGDPCTITGVHHLTSPTPSGTCNLHWDNQDVTVDRSAKLVWTESEAELQIYARNFRLQGSLQSSVGFAELGIRTFGDFIMEGRGRIRARRRVNSIGDEGYVYSTSTSISIGADGQVTLGGSGIKASGAWSYVQVSSDADIQVDSTVSTRAYGDDTAWIYLVAQGSVRTSKRMFAKAARPISGSEIGIHAATGDITIGGALLASSGRIGDTVGVELQAAGNVSVLKNVKLVGADRAGSFYVQAGNDITVLGNVAARGFNRPGEFGEGAGGDVNLRPGLTGKVVLPKTIDVSCFGGCPTEGRITVAPGCYTDVTGAHLFARPDGNISLG